MEAVLLAIQGSGAGLLGLVALIGARLAPTLLLVPWLGASAVPLTVRLALLGGLSVLLTPLVLLTITPDTLSTPRPPVAWLGLGLKEVLIGTFFALMGSVVLWGIDTAGGLIDRLRGHPMVDAAGRSPVGRLTMLIGSALFLLSGGHLLWIAVIARSYQLLPPLDASTVVTTTSMTSVVRLGGEMFVLAAALTLPVAVVLALAEVTLAFVDRLAPHLSEPLRHVSLRALLGLLLVMATMRLALDTAVGGTWDALKAAEVLLEGIP